MGKQVTSRRLIVTALLSSACFVWTAIPAGAAPSCSPTPNGDTGSSSHTAASGTQICAGGDTGIDYTATGGNLVVDLNDDPIFGHAININDDGSARNITVNVGLPSSGYTAASVLANDSNNNGIKLVSSGGDIALTTYTGGTVTYSGTSNASFAINAQTSGSGTIAITTGDAVTDMLGTGISAQAVNGNITISAGGNISAANYGVFAQATGTGNTAISTGVGVTVGTSEEGLVALSAGGTAGATLGANDTITTSASSLSYGIYAQSNQAPGSVLTTTSVATGTGDAITVTGQNSAAISATNQGNGTGGVSVMVGDNNIDIVNGDTSFGVVAQTTDIYGKTLTGSGNVSVQFGNNDSIAVNAGNGVGAILQGSAGVAAISDGGNVSVTWAGTGGSIGAQAANGIGTAGIFAETGGTGTATVATGIGTTVQSGAGDGIDVIAANGSASLTALGNVTATGGDALHAATSGTGDVTIVAGSASDLVTITATDGFHNAVYGVSNGGDVGVTTYGTIAGNMNLSTTGTGNILVTTNGALTGAGDYSSIYATTVNGNIGVTTNGAVTDGLDLESSGTGNVTVTTNGTVTEPGSYSSIYAASNGGNVSITTNNTVSTGLAATTTGAGTITIATNGNITNAQPFDSIYAAGQNGAIQVMVNSGTVNGVQGSDDVEAEASGTGAVTVTLGNNVTLDPATAGVFAGSYSATSSIVTGTGDVITAADTDAAGGLTARSKLSPVSNAVTASITTGANNTVTVTGDDSAGLSAFNEGNGPGGVSITTGTGNAITVTGNSVSGILASTFGRTTGASGNFSGSGNVSISVGGGNTVLVNAGTDNGGTLPASGGVVAATIGGNAQIEWAGAGGSVTVNGQSGISTSGIFALSGAASDAATVSVTTGSGTAVTSNNGYGIVAINGNTGATTIVSNGAVSAQAPNGSNTFAQLFSPSFTAIGGGIIGIGGGAVSVTSNGSVSVKNGDGIDAYAQTTAMVVSNADITSDHSAIAAYAGTSDAIANSGTIEGAGTASNPVIALGALANGVTATVTNDADGTVSSVGGSPSDLAIAAKTAGMGAVTIDNNGLVVGEIDLSNAGAATFDNAGTWATTGTNVFSSGANALNNSGTLVASGTTSFTGIGSFNNTGVLDMHSGNSAAGDVTVINGTFVGGTGSRLAVDSYLGTAASGATCGTLSDCLKTQGATGVTGIIVHDTAPVSAAGYNPTGVLVVTGATSASNFVLDPASNGYNASTKTIDEGLFDYALGYNANGDVRLYSAPSAMAHQLPELVTGAENLWFETSPWLNRQADLRDQMGPDQDGNITPGFWTKAVGNFVQRTGSAGTTIGGSSVTYDTSYNQNSYGVVAGADTGLRGLWASGDALIGGVMGGYVSSDLDFATTGVSAHLSGAFVGAYATYLNDGWVIDGAFKADLLTLRYDSGAASVFDTNPGVHAYGGEVDAGKRLFIDHDVFIEPLASVAYVSTTVGDTSVMGTPTSFGPGSNGRASIGARAGTLEFSTPENIVDLSLTGRLWDAFGGNSHASLLSGATSLPVADNFTGVFGEVGGNLQFLDRHDGWSSFVATSVKFKANFTSETLTVGMRYHW